MKKMKWLLEEESGQGMAEYALIVAFIALLLIGTLTGVGIALVDFFQEVADKIP